MKEFDIAKMVADCKANGHDIGVYDGSRWIINVLVWKTQKSPEEVAKAIQAIADVNLIESLELHLVGDYR